MKADRRKLSPQHWAYILMLAFFVIGVPLVVYERMEAKVKLEGGAYSEDFTHMQVTDLPTNIYAEPLDIFETDIIRGIGYIRENVPLDSLYNDTMETRKLFFVYIDFTHRDWFHFNDEKAAENFKGGWYRPRDLRLKKVPKTKYPDLYKNRLTYVKYDAYLPDVVNVSSSHVIYSKPPSGMQRTADIKDHLGILKHGILYDSVYAVIGEEFKSRGHKNGYVYISFKYKHWFQFNNRSIPKKYRGAWLSAAHAKPVKMDMEDYVDGLQTIYHTQPIYPDTYKKVR